MSKQEVREIDDLWTDFERLRREIRIDRSLRQSEDVKNMMRKLEEAYNDREDVIDLVMFRSGFESRKSLRMFPTEMLKRWADELKT